MMHFENLWEICENFHKENNTPSDSIDHIITKLNLYKSLNENNNFPKDVLQEMKEHLIGEILFDLTYLSLKDNINTFKVLQSSLKSRK